VIAASAIVEEAVMADAMEAVRQGMQQQKTPGELFGCKRHHLGLAVSEIQPAVGDGDAMGVEARRNGGLAQTTRFVCRRSSRPRAKTSGSASSESLAKKRTVTRVGSTWGRAEPVEAPPPVLRSTHLERGRAKLNALTNLGRERFVLPKSAQAVLTDLDRLQLRAPLEERIQLVLCGELLWLADKSAA
jgi:hypothetical protein